MGAKRQRGAGMGDAAGGAHVSADVAYWTSDAVLFYVLQAALMTFVLVAWTINLIGKSRAGRGSVRASVERGERSMGVFYAVDGAVSGVLVAICLASDTAKNHRVVWTLLDAALVAYVCLFNGWFRNKMVEWLIAVGKVEQR